MNTIHVTSDCVLTVTPPELPCPTARVGLQRLGPLRQDLVACLPDDLDEHALHMAISRLRRALGVPGLITTFTKRGYRFHAERID